MSGRLHLNPAAICLLLCVAAAWPPAFAEERMSSGFGEVRLPEPVAPQTAQNCVEPVEIMRRDHMEFLLHQRDAVVVDGDRSGRYGLVDCMNCHAPGDAADLVRYPDPGHFCADCHVYASVRIDCFECHADRGQQGPQADLSRPLPSGPAWSVGANLSVIASRPRHRDDN